MMTSETLFPEGANVLKMKTSSNVLRLWAVRARSPPFRGPGVELIGVSVSRLPSRHYCRVARGALRAALAWAACGGRRTDDFPTARTVQDICFRRHFGFFQDAQSKLLGIHSGYGRRAQQACRANPNFAGCGLLSIVGG